MTLKKRAGVTRDLYRLDLTRGQPRIRVPGFGPLAHQAPWWPERVIETMPTYDYICEKCGHAFEVFQSMSDKALTACPKDHCAMKRWGKGKIRRQIGAGAGLIFKGSGFYITDYRSENYKSGAKKDSDSAKKPSETKTGSSEGKKPTAKKPDKKPAS